MRINLCIKGNKEQANKAATARGISFEFLSENSKQSETYGFTENETYVNSIYNWFNEYGQAPYPTGTLLLFTLK